MDFGRTGNLVQSAKLRAEALSKHFRPRALKCCYKPTGYFNAFAHSRF
jgi:hypothetical protein